MSHLGLFCLLRENSSINELKVQNPPDVPRNERGLFQMITKGNEKVQEGNDKEMAQS